MKWAVSAILVVSACPGLAQSSEYDRGFSEGFEAGYNTGFSEGLGQGRRAILHGNGAFGSATGQGLEINPTNGLPVPTLDDGRFPSFGSGILENPRLAPRVLE